MPGVRIAPYGRRAVGVACAVGLAAALAMLPLGPLAAAPLAFPAFVAYFYRDPHRRASRVEGAVLAPADGRVTDIEEMDEPRFLCAPAVRIGIFLSPLDVHVNRVPCAGRVAWVERRPGRFRAAFRRDAIDGNERVSLGMEVFGEPPRRLRFDQVAGFLARRIICACAPGDRMSAGERFGMIQLGSRAEVWMPKTHVGEVSVRTGDPVRAGETVLALWSRG